MGLPSISDVGMGTGTAKDSLSSSTLAGATDGRAGLGCSGAGAAGDSTCDADASRELVGGSSRASGDTGSTSSPARVGAGIECGNDKDDASSYQTSASIKLGGNLSNIDTRRRIAYTVRWKKILVTPNHPRLRRGYPASPPMPMVCTICAVNDELIKTP